MYLRQEFNLTGALSYLRGETYALPFACVFAVGLPETDAFPCGAAVLLPMAVLSLVVPRFTKSDGGSVSPLLGVWLLCMSAGLYGLFLFMQVHLLEAPCSCTWAPNTRCKWPCSCT